MKTSKCIYVVGFIGNQQLKVIKQESVLLVRAEIFCSE